MLFRHLHFLSAGSNSDNSPSHGAASLPITPSIQSSSLEKAGSSSYFLDDIDQIGFGLDIESDGLISAGELSSDHPDEWCSSEIENSHPGQSFQRLAHPSTFMSMGSGPSQQLPVGTHDGMPVSPYQPIIRLSSQQPVGPHSSPTLLSHGPQQLPVGTAHGHMPVSPYSGQQPVGPPGLSSGQPIISQKPVGPHCGPTLGQAEISSLSHSPLSYQSAADASPFPVTGNSVYCNFYAMYILVFLLYHIVPGNYPLTQPTSHSTHQLQAAISKDYLCTMQPQQYCAEQPDIGMLSISM